MYLKKSTLRAGSTSKIKFCKGFKMVPDPNLLLSDLLQSQKLMTMQPIKKRKSFFIEKCYLHNYSKLLRNIWGDHQAWEQSEKCSRTR